MRFNQRRHSKLLCSAAMFALLAATPTIAQEAEDDEDGTRRLNEITVTATRREASIQDVPIAVSAFDPETLEAQGVRDITTLSTVSSSFSLQSSQTESGGTSIRIRGIGTTGNNLGLESAVGVFLDGVYLSRPGIALGDLVDLQQLEVLRGPQGTLFGRNTSSGALNITTRKPDLQEIDGFGNISYGNRDFINVQGGVSVPLIQDQLAVRLSGSYRGRDGLLSNPTLGIDSNDRDRWSLRGQVLWEPTDAISIRLIGDYAETSEQCCDAVIIQDLLQTDAATGLQNNGAPVSGLGIAEPFTALGPVPSTGVVDPTGGAPFIGFDALDDRLTNSEQFENPVEQYGISGQLDWDLGFATLTYIGAYREFDAASVQESDFTSLQLFSVGGTTAGDASLGNAFGTPGSTAFGFTSDAEAAAIASTPTTTSNQLQTHEIRFQGAAFDDRLDWLVGGFYSNEDLAAQGSLTLGQDFDFGLAAALFGGGFEPAIFGGPAPLGSAPIQSLTGILSGGLLPLNPSGSFALNRFEQAGQSWSIFTHNTFAVTDRFSATVGLRWVDEQKDGSFDQLAAQSDACAGVIAAAAGGSPLAIFGTGFIPAACFPFSTVANLPTAGGGAGVTPGDITQIAPIGIGVTPLTFSDDADEQGLFVEDFEDDELVYTIKGSYKFTDDVNGYASFTHGFKAGGFNLDASAAIGGADPRFGSEEVDAWEVGIKADLFDGRVRANGALFHQIVDDFQVLEFTGVQFQTFNVARALSTGVELEVFAQVTDQLSLTSNTTYTDARYPNDCTEPGETFINATSLCGFELTNAPNFVGIWGASWEDGIQAFGQELNYFGNVNVRYETDRRTSTQGLDVDGPGLGNGFVPVTQGLNPLDIQEANTKVNLRAGIGRADGLWQLEAWVTNVTDEQTRSITFNVPLRGDVNSRGAFIEEPRTYGVTLRTKF